MGASSETLKLNLALLENSHQNSTQGLQVLRTKSSREAGDGLKLQGSPLCRTSGTCFSSKCLSAKPSHLDRLPEQAFSIRSVLELKNLPSESQDQPFICTQSLPGTRATQSDHLLQHISLEQEKLRQTGLSTSRPFILSSD